MASSEPAQRSGSGEPMVLIHGVAGAWRAWHGVAPRLAERFDVLAVALAGHEDGAAPPGVPLTVASMTDAVERDMDAAGFATAHLVGNSLGGWIALELAKRGRARTVVALSPAGGWTAGSPQEQRIVRSIHMGHRLNRWAAPRARAMMRRGLWKRLMYSQAMAHPERLAPEVAAAAIRAFAAARIPEFMENVEGSGGVRDLDRVTCPVLIAWAEKDRILPSKAYAAPFDEGLPRAERTVMRDVGHVAMWDDPALVADLVLGFAGRHAAA
jgi:pimeloyl-ACP methyl ester carboxylesterase